MHAIAVIEEEWMDASRDRVVPVRVYAPSTFERPAPPIVFSHATGGARQGYEYLGRHWASRGYVSVHLQHRGSDIDVWRGKAGGAMPALRRAAADPQNSVDRVRDTIFAIDRLEAMNEGGSPLAGALDLDRVGLAGHSYGAATALFVAGQAFMTPSGVDHVVSDPRVKAVIAMSAPRPWSTTPDAMRRIFSAVRAPCLHFTGTRDDSPLNDTSALDRRIAFDQLGASDQLLITFDGGDHMVFAGNKRLFDDAPKDRVFQDVVRHAATAFFDAHLRGDAAARAWLVGAGLADLVADHGTLEVKLAARTEHDSAVVLG